MVNKAKAIIAKHYKMNDNDAMRLLQQESRKQSRKLQEVAQAVISSKFILD
jgi:AmiR/NasT family two-component response regulator